MGKGPWGPAVVDFRDLTSPKLMRLACFRISVSPSRSFILRYLGQEHAGLSRDRVSHFPQPSTASPEGPTCGRLASCAAHQEAQAVASPASRVVAPATCQTCAQSHP